jgi:glycolate oxidase
MGKVELLDAPLESLVDKTELVRRLAAVLPPECLLHEHEDLTPYECDGPPRIARCRSVPPETEDRCASAAHLFRGARAVVARGAGTGLSAARCRSKA